MSVAMLLSIYCILMTLMDTLTLREKLQKSLRYLYMGLLGAGMYYVILQVLLRIQGKELDTYQGINTLESAGASGEGLMEMLAVSYRDFGAFSLKGNVLFNGWISAAAIIILGISAAWTLTALCLRKKWWKNPAFFVIMALLAAVLPLVTNAILFISRI